MTHPLKDGPFSDRPDLTARRKAAPSVQSSILRMARSARSFEHPAGARLRRLDPVSGGFSRALICCKRRYRFQVSEQRLRVARCWTVGYAAEDKCWYSVETIGGKEHGMIELTFNGTVQQLDVDPDMPLLWAIRGVVGLTGTRYGCGDPGYRPGCCQRAVQRDRSVF